MADIKQSEIKAGVIVNAIELKMTSVAMGGVAPSLSGEAFVPYFNEDDGILRYKRHDNPANDEADLGGLFTLALEQPAYLVQVLADLSSSVAWAVHVVTSAGDWEVASGTSRYVVVVQPKITLMPGEHVKFTAGDPTGKPWVRLYLQSAQVGK